MTNSSPIIEASSGRVRVFVIEATQMACELVSHILQKSQYDLTVVGCSASLDDKTGFRLVESDAVVISSNLEEGPHAGFDLLKSLVKTSRSTRCVMLLDRGDRDLIVEAFRCGAVGVYERNQSFEMLPKCVHSVGCGQVWANNQQLIYIMEALASGMVGRVTDIKGQHLLTRREDEICNLVAEGLKNREIANQLQLSEHTVKNHLFRIFETLGISSRTELILYILGQRNNGGH